MISLPAMYAAKIGLYDDVTVHSTSVKVRVVDNSEVVNLGISELKSELGKSMVVGIMGKNDFENTPLLQMIVLCVKSRCLIIQVCRLQLIPHCLTDFLRSKDFCFVGPVLKETLACLSSFTKVVPDGYSSTKKISFENSSGMDVRDLAAKVLQDPKLLRRNQMVSKPIQIQSIADKAGVALDKNSSDYANRASIDLASLSFSREEIKHLVADVYASYLIAVKLFNSL